MHFPDSEPAPEEQEQDPHYAATRVDWRTASSVVTKKRIRWALRSFKPFKSTGPGGIFPALLQREDSQVIPWLKGMFRASIALGHVPRAWRLVRVVYLPKPGKGTYSSTRDFRPIVLPTLDAGKAGRQGNKSKRQGSVSYAASWRSTCVHGREVC